MGSYKKKYVSLQPIYNHRVLGKPRKKQEL